jgi:hypothetical protein
MSSCFFIGLLVRNNLPTDTTYLLKGAVPWSGHLNWGLRLGLTSKFRYEKIPRNRLGAFFVKR